jgi:hypothetical protein
MNLQQAPFMKPQFSQKTGLAEGRRKNCAPAFADGKSLKSCIFPKKRNSKWVDAKTKR